LNNNYETVKLNYLEEKELHQQEMKFNNKERKVVKNNILEAKSHLKETTESWFRMREKSSEKNKEYKNRMNCLK
jgi:hypothetical protein